MITSDWPMFAATMLLVVATGLGTFFIYRGLVHDARATREQNDILRRRESMRMYMTTLEIRDGAARLLPSIRDADAVSAFIDAALAGADEDARAKQSAIRKYLNYWETVATGVSAGVLDEATLRRVARGRVRQVYAAYLPFIEARRDAGGNRDLWVEFERLAQRWRAE